MTVNSFNRLRVMLSSGWRLVNWSWTSSRIYVWILCSTEDDMNLKLHHENNKKLHTLAIPCSSQRLLVQNVLSLFEATYYMLAWIVFFNWIHGVWKKCSDLFFIKYFFLFLCFLLVYCIFWLRGCSYTSFITLTNFQTLPILSSKILFA